MFNETISAMGPMPAYAAAPGPAGITGTVERLLQACANAPLHRRTRLFTVPVSDPVVAPYAPTLVRDADVVDATPGSPAWSPPV